MVQDSRFRIRLRQIVWVFCSKDKDFMVHIHDSVLFMIIFRILQFIMNQEKISSNTETENGLFQDSPHIRWEVISWFMIHGSGFILDKLFGYFVRKIETLWFIFMITVLFIIIFRILDFILK